MKIYDQEKETDVRKNTSSNFLLNVCEMQTSKNRSKLGIT